MLENSEVAGKLYELTSGDQRNWRKLLKFGETLSLDEKRKFLWTWPTEENLTKFKSICKLLEIDNILSIGCGSGLLEWIIQESVDISVYGLEVDKTWWTSGYAVKSFIDLNYMDESDDNDASATSTNASEYLQLCAHASNWQFAILFCYFNNRLAFTNYLQLYKGTWIIIIGPTPNIGIHTDPNPWEPNFPVQTWHLHSIVPLCDSDVAAFYTNK